jgi:hypothetical protein
MKYLTKYFMNMPRRCGDFIMRFTVFLKRDSARDLTAGKNISLGKEKMTFPLLTSVINGARRLNTIISPYHF